MKAPRPDLAEADLPALFPDASPEQLDRIRRATDRMSPGHWHWSHGPGRRYLFGGAVYLGEDADDQVELNLDVCLAEGSAGVEVSASIGIWCQCPQDHNMHFVRDVETTATTPEELTAAIEAAVDQVVQWRETASPDADRWRAEAGLPLKRG
ncbi:hypothetical protein ACIA8G_34625 [Lentzea sp. NPDC051213]|uniref:hypothetical protein n=1 Tax=Lentzea sp. NPDC051213 TaxID=3364126 RepID=UPI00378C7076